MVWRQPFPLNGRSLSSEGEVHAGEILKAILCSSVARTVYAEAGIQVVHFARTQLDGLGQNKVQPATELHGEGVVIAAAEDVSVHDVVDMRVGIAVGSAEGRFHKRLHLSGVFLKLRPEHVGEDVTAELTDGVAIMDQRILNAAALGVALEVSFDANHWRELVDETAAAAEDVEAGDGGDVGMHVDEGEPDRDL